MSGSFKRLVCLIGCSLMVAIPCFNNEFQSNKNDKTITINNNLEKKSGNSTELRVEMIDLGYNGDSTIITFGNTQILVDAGGDTPSGQAITNALKNELLDKNDKKLEYVIMTHADYDHIVNVNSPNNSLLNFLKTNDISVGCWIDFDMGQDKSVVEYMKSKGLSYKLESMFWSSSTLRIRKSTLVDYDLAKSSLLSKGKLDYYFTSSQCTYKKRVEYNSDYSDYVDKFLFQSKNLIQNETTNKIKQNVSQNKELLTDTFTLYSEPDEEDVFGSNNGGDTAELKILYNPYYSSFCTGNSVADEIDKNACSTCFVINYNEDQWVFNGDIQEYKSSKSESSVPSDDNDVKENDKDASKTTGHGSYKYIGCETELLAYNADVLKEGAMFYKASHHGSDTSNSSTLLNHIKPQFVGISAAATARTNTLEKEEDIDKAFKFPGQYALDSIGKWTDYIGITDYRERIGGKWQTKPYFGSLIYTYNPKLLYKMSFTSTNISGVNNSILDSPWFIKNRQFPIKVYLLSNDSKKNSLNSECTYIKVGHNDILLNAGAYDSNAISSFVNKERIKGLCNDKIFELCVINSCFHDAYHDLIIQKDKNIGLLFDSDFVFEDIRYPNYDSMVVEGTNWSNLEIPSVINEYIDKLPTLSTDQEERSLLKEKSIYNKQILKSNISNKTIINKGNNKLGISLNLYSSDNSISAFSSKDDGLISMFNIDGEYSESNKASSNYSFLYGGYVADETLFKGKVIPNLNPNNAVFSYPSYQISRHGYLSLNTTNIVGLYAKRVVDASSNANTNLFLNGKILENNDGSDPSFASQAFVQLASSNNCTLYSSNGSNYPLLCEEIKVGYQQFKVKKPDEGIISRSVKYEYLYSKNSNSFDYSASFYTNLLNEFKGKTIGGIENLYKAVAFL